MKTQEIARHLLNRRNAMNPVLLPGEMIGAIGSDAMQEALQKRWLVANPDSGLLQISPEMAKVEEMRECAEKCEKCGKAECECKTANMNESHNYAFDHALRRAGGLSPLEELLSPMTGHSNDSGLMKRGPGTPVPPTPLTPTTPPKAKVGDNNTPVGAAVIKDDKLQIDLDNATAGGSGPSLGSQLPPGTPAA